MYTGHYDCCSPRCYPAPCGPYYVPVVWVAVPPECCEPHKVSQEIDADAKNDTATALIGGTGKVSLSLEYLVEGGGASPSVKVTTTSDGVSSTWSDDTPAAGYHVREALLSVDPGTKVTLSVKDVTARLRWCETICC